MLDTPPDYLVPEELEDDAISDGGYEDLNAEDYGT